MSLVDFICPVCEIPKKFRPSDLKNRQYCSRSCMSIAFKDGRCAKKPRRGENKICPICLQEFYVGPHFVEIGAKYCSPQCNGIAQRKRVTIVCRNCSIAFEQPLSQSHVEFCSKRCWYEYNCGPNHYSWKGLITLICKQCLQPFQLIPERVNAENPQKFCSKSCQYIFFRGAGNPNWRGGETFEDYGPAFNSSLKLLVRKRDNFTCQICGESESTRSHDVHHIDYIKKNNNPENLITLCANCHKRTNGDRTLWMEFFQRGEYLKWQSQTLRGLIAGHVKLCELLEHPESHIDHNAVGNDKRDGSKTIWIGQSAAEPLKLPDYGEGSTTIPLGVEFKRTRSAQQAFNA